MRRRLALVFLLVPLCGCNVQQMFGFGGPADEQPAVEDVTGEETVDGAPADESSSAAEEESSDGSAGDQAAGDHADHSVPAEQADAQASQAVDEPTGVRKGQKVGVKKGSKREAQADTTSQPATQGDAVAPVQQSSAALNAEPVSYGGFTSDVIGNGQKSLLFFYAPWCPYCQDDDVILTRMYQAGTPNISTYKVDFDTAFDLRDKYGVVSQHTFVLIDGNGKTIDSYYNPSTADFAVYLKQ